MLDSTRSALPWLIAGLPPHDGSVLTAADLATAVQQARAQFDEARRSAR